MKHWLFFQKIVHSNNVYACLESAAGGPLVHRVPEKMGPEVHIGQQSLSHQC